MSTEQIYVVGHKNPDTDSVCSAIAYAELCRRQGRDNVAPARAGSLNRQTEFILETLEQEPPRLLMDVYPRVKDIIGPKVISIRGEMPLAKALELMNRHDIRMLPILDGERKPLGMLILKRISERILIPGDESRIRQVHTSPVAICACLKAEADHLVDGDRVEVLDLYVGAMASATFHDRMAAADPRRMVLLTGDREDIQREVIELGARVLVVTGNMRISPEILDLAREKGVSVLRTPFDTATSALLTRLSTPVSCLVDSDFLSVGLQDQVEDLRLKLVHSPDPGALVLDSEGRVTAVVTKGNLLAPSSIKLILVDHNELSQAVPGADKVEILEVIDHHRLGNFHTNAPIRFINQPLGSTCSVVATLYQQAGIAPAPASAAVMLAGLLSDTVILKSPTTTAVDRELAEWLGDKAGLDPQEFGQRIFSAGSSLASYPRHKDLLLADFKEYQVDAKKFGVGQVEVVNFHEFHTMKDELALELGSLRRSRKLDMIALLVTDIVQGTSLLLVDGAADLPYRIGYSQIEPGLYELKGVLSRKKQLVPHLLKILKD